MNLECTPSDNAVVPSDDQCYATGWRTGSDMMEALTADPVLDVDDHGAVGLKRHRINEPYPAGASDVEGRSPMSDQPPITPEQRKRRVISDDAAHRIGVYLDTIERIVREEENQRTDHGPPLDLPESLRKRMMGLGSSVHDLNFWIRRVDDDDLGGQRYVLSEIESGLDLEGVEPRELCDDYFRADVMDGRRV